MGDSPNKWSTASPSLLFVGSLLQHCRKNLEVLQTRRKSNKDLKDFIKDMKEQTRQISSELEEEDPPDHRWHIRRASDAVSVPAALPKSNQVMFALIPKTNQVMFALIPKTNQVMFALIPTDNQVMCDLIPKSNQVMCALIPKPTR